MEHRVMLTSKSVHIALKRDDGLTWLMERYSFEQPEQLFEVIRKATPLPEAERLIRKIKKKYRFEYKSKISERLSQDTDEESFEESIIQKQIAVEDSLETKEQPFETSDDSLGSDVESERKAVAMKKVDELNCLRERRLEISQKLCVLELSHKELVAKRRKLLIGFTEKKARLEELKALVEKEEKEIESLYKEHSKCASQMSDLNKEWTIGREELEKISERITGLEKIVLYVYEDGTIEAENVNLPVIDEEMIKKFLMELICNPSVLNMTVSQLNCIAKLRFIKQFLSDEGRVSEIEFESTSMQTLWNSFAE